MACTVCLFRSFSHTHAHYRCWKIGFMTKRSSSLFQVCTLFFVFSHLFSALLSSSFSSPPLSNKQHSNLAIFFLSLCFIFVACNFFLSTSICSFFLWFHELITIITGHYQTGETLPGTWRQKLLNAKVCCLSFVVFVVWFDEVS